MDAIEQLKQDVREGRFGVDRLIDVIATLQRQLESAKQRLEELEKKVGGTATAKVDKPFSMRAEEKRQQARHKKKKPKLSRKGRRGRLTVAVLSLTTALPKHCVFPCGIVGNWRS
jgi:transposase